jgi:hypothetical protein
VLTAVVYCLLMTAYVLFIAARATADDWPGAPTALLALCPAPAAHGLWRGHRGARTITVTLAAVLPFLIAHVDDPAATALITALLGLLVIALLTAPPSSRAWFARGSARAEEP